MSRVGAALVCLACILASGARVPLYDGLGFPDQPYRHLPPARAGEPPPGAATARLDLVAGVNRQGRFASSPESGPQVSVYLPVGALAVPAAGSGGSVDVTAAPEPAGPDAPARRRSNVYRVSATSPEGAVRLRPEAQPPRITLRADSAEVGGVAMSYRRPGMAWEGLQTTRVGTDIFSAAVPGFGDFVLAGGAPHNRSAYAGVAEAVGVAVLLLAAALLALRRRAPHCGRRS